MGETIWYQGTSTDEELQEVMRRTEDDREGLEQTSEDDRIWFEAHPDANFRIRDASDHEKAVGTHCNQVLVVQLEPGVRVRLDVIATGFDHESAPDWLRWGLFEHVTAMRKSSEFTQNLRGHMAKKLGLKSWRALVRNNPVTSYLSEQAEQETKH